MSTQRACPEQFRKTNRRHREGRPPPAATWDSCRFPNANRRWTNNLLSGQRYADRKPDTRSSRTWRTPRRRRPQISRSASLSQAPAQESRIFLRQWRVAGSPATAQPKPSPCRGTTRCARSSHFPASQNARAIGARHDVPRQALAGLLASRFVV